MILTVGATKGGVGKTTIAVNIAIARALQRREVWLIDGDLQRTAQLTITQRFSYGQKPDIACDYYSDGQTLRSQVLRQKNKFDDIVIDVGGRDSQTMRAAMMLTDILLVPFQPRSYDVWALNDIVTLIDEVNGMRDGLRCLAMLNLDDPVSSADNREAAKTIEDYPQLKYLPTSLKKRKAFSTAVGSGLSVIEYKPQDAKAIEELSALVSALFSS